MNLAQRDRLARISLWMLAIFTLVAVIGYGTFGRHPGLLARWPDLSVIYAWSFTAFAQGQVWLSAAVLLALLIPRVGWVFVASLGASYLISFTAEFSGTTWGLPFGGYAYTSLLGPMLAERVPVVIPLSWWLMALPSYALAARALPRAPFKRIWLGSLLLLVWDLALDPAMSYLTTYWVWSETGPYYGMPFLNLLGWYVTGIALMAAMTLLRVERWSQRVPAREMAAFYGITLAMPLGMVVVAGEWLAVAVTGLGLGAAVLAIRAAARGEATDPGSGPGRRWSPDLEDDAAWAEAVAEVRRGLDGPARRMRSEGMARFEPEGQMIRPLAALAAARGLGLGGGDLDERFWWGVAAVQLAHEASLVHDDILDDAKERRGRPTLVAEAGVARALVHGDHLLTSAYRAAALTGSAAFMAAFARAVERTVAGEIAQARAQGQALTLERYDDIVRGKSGELFGLAVATASLVYGRGQAERSEGIGREVGRAYQMLDDLLDYCPTALTGKPPLQDHRQGKWTWPQAWLSPERLGLLGQDPLAALFSPDLEGGLRLSPMRRAVTHYDGVVADLVADIRRDLGGAPVLTQILQGWRERAHGAVRAEEVAAGRPATELLAAELGDLRTDADWLRAFTAHARSFRFAARFFPADVRDRVAGVYAFCRFTDDLADRQPGLDAGTRGELLDAWQGLCSRAYYGEASGLPLVDRVMGEAAAAGVPFHYIADLIEGMRMDLRPVRYRDMAELERYTYRVASVVGLWLARLWGVDDATALTRARALGHGMQLTNILRDVGEDWRAGRLYIPEDVLTRHGVSEADIDDWAHGRSEPTPEWRAVVADLTSVAEAAYAQGLRGVPALPIFARRAVAVAAFVYRGLHDAIAALGARHLQARAVVPLARKIRLAAAALVALPGIEREARQARARVTVLGTVGGEQARAR
jgi:phytoene/squalene synthetase/geranylgeranyl pyrophosphate synthase/uncharacterized membrane protein